LLVAGAVVLVLLVIMFARQVESVRADRRRERVRAELGPVFSNFFDAEYPVRLAEQLRPAFLRMDGAHRPVAAVLVTDLVRDASPSRCPFCSRVSRIAGRRSGSRPSER
jgi:hypothetical protein